ncbi:unnamed protein product [Brassica oleracea var. botrytis]
MDPREILDSFPLHQREGSIAVGAYVNNQPQKKPVRRKKPAPLGNVVPSVGGVWCFLSL